MRFNFGGWIAPEVIDGKSYAANAVDVFSFGILLCEIVSGLQVEELPRDEGQKFAHMGIGALDMTALRDALQPFIDEGAPQELVSLALKAVSPAADKRPAMETAMLTLSKLTSANKAPDFFDLHADMHAVAALEKEVAVYIERFRALELKSGGSGRVSSCDLTAEREASDYRFSRSFIKEGDEIVGRLKGLVDKTEESNPKHVADSATAVKTSTCVVS